MVIRKEKIISIKKLIVDDEIIFEDTSERLTEEGYVLLVASNREEMLDILRRSLEITVVLSDIYVLGKSSLQMINATQLEVGKDHHLKLIILNGHCGSNELHF